MRRKEKEHRSRGTIWGMGHFRESLTVCHRKEAWSCMWCEVIPGEFALFLLLEEHSRNDSRCNHKRKHLEEEEACCPEHVADVKNKEESQC